MNFGVPQREHDARWNVRVRHRSPSAPQAHHKGNGCQKRHSRPSPPSSHEFLSGNVVLSITIRAEINTVTNIKLIPKQ